MRALILLGHVWEGRSDLLFLLLHGERLTSPLLRFVELVQRHEVQAEDVALSVASLRTGQTAETALTFQSAWAACTASASPDWSAKSTSKNKSFIAFETV